MGKAYTAICDNQTGQWKISVQLFDIGVLCKLFVSQANISHKERDLLDCISFFVAHFSLVFSLWFMNDQTQRKYWGFCMKIFTHVILNTVYSALLPFDKSDFEPWCYVQIIWYLTHEKNAAKAGLPSPYVHVHFEVWETSWNGKFKSLTTGWNCTSFAFY